jgi:hypothetical protein
MLKLNLRPALKQLSRDLDRLQRHQIPFAAAQALTATARDAAEVETKALPTEFDNPTPFTLKAFGVIPARKHNLTAVLFARDAQAKYLEPSAFGGRQVLGSKRAILTPRDLATNQYGNLPKGKLQALRGRPDIFIGEVKTKHGTVGGVWQRVNVTRQGKVRRGKAQRGSAYAPGAGQLKLLIQFTRPSTVTKRIPYDVRVKRTVAARLQPNWNKAIEAALKSAR